MAFAAEGRVWGTWAEFCFWRGASRQELWELFGVCVEAEILKQKTVAVEGCEDQGSSEKHIYMTVEGGAVRAEGGERERHF